MKLALILGFASLSKAQNFRSYFNPGFTVSRNREGSPGQASMTHARISPLYLPSEACHAEQRSTWMGTTITLLKGGLTP